MINDFKGKKREVKPYARLNIRAGFFTHLIKKGVTAGRSKSFWQYVGVTLAAGLLAGTLGIIGLFAWAAKDLPDPNNINLRNVPQTTRIFDRTGAIVLYEVHGAQKRTVVDLENIADSLEKATLAAEDRNFYTHKGFDLRGILRGFLKNITRDGGKLQSGSTITQQFIKKSILNDEQTYTRKVKELILSIEIERRFSKDQILKLYLNEVPYGSVAYGIESASETFFGKKASELTLSESALLAALPKGPTYYSPYGNHRDDLIARQRYIIDAMVELGYATAEEGEEAKKDDILARIQPNKNPITAPHFVFYVKELLAQEFGEHIAEQGGLKVITTLDIEKQKAAEEAITSNIEQIKKWEANTAALTAIDPKTGEVLAMVGSADYFDDEINGKYNAVLGRLQPGSSIKPMVYAAAFEKGYTPSTVLEDIKTDFSTTSTPYSPNNYDGQERGFVTIKEALAGSLNIPAVKVLYLTGLGTFQDFAERVGYTTFGDQSRFGLSLVLGGAEVRPLEHVNAFSAFAQEGIIHDSIAIMRVEDADGKVLKDDAVKPPGRKVFDSEVARQINDILSDNAARAYVFGEQNYLTLGNRPAAAKTGTTNDYKDAWTVGYTPSLVAGVWVGDAAGQNMKKGADGSKIAAPIWKKFMTTALAGTPVENFTPPTIEATGKPVLDGEKNSQVKLKIDRVSGKLATEHTPPEYVEERGFGVPHSILFFVDKDDPRGPNPENPEKDPQYEKWERSVAEWAMTQELELDVNPPPTEMDDVHIPENKPEVSLIFPSSGDTVSDRTFRPSVAVSARRGVAKVEYAMDGETIATSVYSPFDGPVSVPNRFGKGFHTFTATAFDDVGNRNSTTVTMNFTAAAGPIGIRWKTLWSNQLINSSQFPFSIELTLDDPKSIKVLRVISINQSTGETGTIGSIENPALPGISVQWQTPPSSGSYLLTIQATLTSNEEIEERLPIIVQ